MAKNTNINLFNSTIYSVYVRNHTESGDFKGLIDDLDRIADLGVDTVWLMPIHPIGKHQRKGSLGCPYSIMDYRAINPEYGTIDDFKKLINEMHARSINCMIDVVYNHASKDSKLTQSNPEFFIKDKDGNVTSKVDDWTDVADFDFSNHKLWDELIDTLDYWCSIGVDGFRCDVASLVPIEFWQEAREKLMQKYPDVIFLAESCGLDFIEELREQGSVIHTDSEIFTAFDMAYDYDMRDTFYHLTNTKDYYPGDFADRLYVQNNIYPQNAVKLRFIENHDNTRAAKAISDYYELINYTALMFFQKGAALVYAGQETMETKTPSLFEKDLINLEVSNQEFYNYLKRLIALKKQQVFRDGFFRTIPSDDKYALHLCYVSKENMLHGVFNLNNTVEAIKVNIADGTYENIINGQKINVRNSKVQKSDMPAFFITEK